MSTQETAPTRGEAAGPDASTWFPQRLRQRASATPEGLAYRFFQGAAPARTLTFLQLWQQASTLAAHLVDRGWRGRRALLVCKSEQAFVVAFHACLLAGVVAVPSAPPRRQTLQERLQLLADDSGATGLLCDVDDVAGARLQTRCGELEVVDVRGMPAWRADAGTFEPVAVTGSSLAFLQYTSGSTGNPKGVAVSHANMIDNSERIRQAMDIGPGSAVLIGLPLFHDMGLVGGVFQSLYAGCSASFMSPAELVQYPLTWLRRISELRITTSGGPNFMYELAADEIRAEDVRGLDLSCWRVAFCGAEPVRASTVRRFSEKLAPAGFDPGAFFPCYGMAEATLFIAGGPAGRRPRIAERDGAEIVCCGLPASGMDLRIVEPQAARPLPDGEIGEIWVSGESIAQGYWRKPDLSAETFHASLAGEPSRRYLRTGDLGWLQDGRLHVSGRLKDLVIVNGRKYAPHDIEETVEKACADVRRSGAIAFGVCAAASPDRLVVVAELERVAARQHAARQAASAAIRQAVHAAHGLPVADVVLLAPGQLPRTSSGKVRRSQCRQAYAAGDYATTAADPNP